MRKFSHTKFITLFAGFLISLVILSTNTSIIFAANYGNGNYGAGIYGEGENSPTPSNNTSTASAPICTDQAPGPKAPWLYGAIAENPNNLLLYFTEADTPVNKYLLEYGLAPYKYLWGAQDLGVNSRSQMTYLVKSLTPNTTYYFRVRGGNGCAVGTWSNELSAKTKHIVTFNQLEVSQLELEPVESTEQTQTSGDDSSTPTNYIVTVKAIFNNNKPVAEAHVAIFPGNNEVATNQDGIAVFKEIPPGEHKVLVTYRKFQSEQTIYLTGNVKDFNLTVTVQQKLITLSPLVLGIGVIIIASILVILLYVRKR